MTRRRARKTTPRQQAIIDTANAALIVLAGFHIGRLLRQVVRAPEAAAPMIGVLAAAAGVCLLVALYHRAEGRW